MSEANVVTGKEYPPQVVEQSPFAIPSKKLAIWLFIIADGMTFAAILVAYGFLRNASPNWPRPFHSIVNVAIMTFILISSSFTMLMAVQAARLGNRARAVSWMLITVAGGIVFAILHIREWLGLINDGVGLSKNPWGDSLFGSTFFGITGLHLTHVVGGVIALIAVTFLYKSGRYSADHIETVGLYWHFVDLVWMFVVPMVYLLNFTR
jgi:cytochrome c oxidase subunit III